MIKHLALCVRRALCMQCTMVRYVHKCRDASDEKGSLFEPFHLVVGRFMLRPCLPDEDITHLDKLE